MTIHLDIVKKNSKRHSELFKKKRENLPIQNSNLTDYDVPEYSGLIMTESTILVHSN